MSEAEAVLHARSAGPLARGVFRAVVIEADTRVTCKDFSAEGPARQYADDAASETEHGIVLAYVVDDGLRVIHRGHHY